MAVFRNLWCMLVTDGNAWYQEDVPTLYRFLLFYCFRKKKQKLSVFLPVKVATLVGLPPTPCRLERFLRTANARCSLVMRQAFDVVMKDAPD